MGSSRRAINIAQTAPTGVANSTRPRVEFDSPSVSLTCGMCAVHDANRSPCEMNVAVTAARWRARAAAWRGACGFPSAISALDTEHVNACCPQSTDGLGRRVCVGDQHVGIADIADHGDTVATELG